MNLPPQLTPGMKLIGPGPHKMKFLLGEEKITNGISHWNLIHLIDGREITGTTYYTHSELNEIMEKDNEV